jgi:hypothetical protein
VSEIFEREMVLKFKEVFCLNQEIEIVSRAFNTFTLFGNMMSKSNDSLYSTVGASELEEGGGHSIDHSKFYEPTTLVTPSCGRKYNLMAFISLVITIVGVTFVVSAYGGAERSLESIRRNLSDYNYYKVSFNFYDPVVVECTKSVSEIPSISEIYQICIHMSIHLIDSCIIQISKYSHLYTYTHIYIDFNIYIHVLLFVYAYT